ncbi:hypothetical protein P4S63_19475 [Pseudoalteromonas sp. B193]
MKSRLKQSTPLDDSVNKHKNNGNVVHNPWSDLRRFTDARIGLGRAV